MPAVPAEVPAEVPEQECLREEDFQASVPVRRRLHGKQPPKPARKRTRNHTHKLGA